MCSSEYVGKSTGNNIPAAKLGTVLSIILERSLQ
jgi:hypothetical protein